MSPSGSENPPLTSRVWVVRAWGDLSEETRMVEPPGPEQVRVAMRAASLNFRDHLMWRGQYDPRVLPYVPLSDGVGVVESVGERVTRWREGDRVMMTFSPDWIEGPLTLEGARQTRGGQVDGVLSDHCVVHESELVRVPKHLSDVEAATLPCAGVTAWRALHELGRLHPGDCVLTMGSGGVASWALTLSKLAGATVVATTSSAARADALTTLGADHVVNRLDTPAWGRPIRKWAGEGVDVVVDVGGAETLTQSLEAVRLGGRIALIGVLSGVESTLNVLPILMKQVRVQGVFVGPRTSLEALSECVETHHARPWVGQVLNLDSVALALSTLSAGEHLGHTCLAWPEASLDHVDGPPPFSPPGDS